MSWEEGNQKSKRVAKLKPNEELAKIEGFIEEEEAKVLLYQFLRNNITYSTNLITGVELYPFQHILIKSMLESDYFLAVLSRGLSKSFSAGIYAVLEAIFNQGISIGILSKSFRQTKLLFKKIEEISETPDGVLLRQAITKMTKSNDEWTMQIGKSYIRALPLGDGERLRGYRFNIIIIDELLLMPENVIKEVIMPFLAVVRNPQDRTRMAEMENRLISEGKMKEEDRYVWPNNKLIGLYSA